MFDDLLNNMEQQQQKVETALASIEITESMSDPDISITVDGNSVVKNIRIMPDGLNDHEELEDKLVILFNKVLNRTHEIKEIEMNKLVSNMNIPGLGGLGNFFNK